MKGMRKRSTKKFLRRRKKPMTITGIHKETQNNKIIVDLKCKSLSNSKDKCMNLNKNRPQAKEDT